MEQTDKLAVLIDADNAQSLVLTVTVIVYLVISENKNLCNGKAETP